jgi:P27 family predicted phage terminase small subunit
MHGGGRKPKPARLKLIDGNPGQRPIQTEPEPDRTIADFDCPEHLVGEARAEWMRLYPDMAAKRVITRWDRAALSAYCTAWGLLVEAETKCNVDGVMLVAQRTKVMRVNPWVSIARHAKVELLRFAAELGLTPVARARLGTIEAKPESASDVPAEVRDVSGGS